MSTTVTLSIEPLILSDHSHITGEISPGHTEPAMAANIIKQQWKKFNIDAFQHDLLDSHLYMNPPSTSSDYSSTSSDFFTCYKDVLYELLDKHATKRSSVQHECQKALWFNTSYRRVKQATRCAKEFY